MLAILAALSLGQAPAPTPLENTVYKLRNTAAADVAAAITKSASGKPFNITPEPISNTLFISGTAADVVRFIEQISALDVAPDQFFISATLCEGDPLGSKAAGTLKVLAEPKLMVTDKSTGGFRVAGRPETTGVMLEVRAEKVESGKVRLRITVERTTAEGTNDDFVRTQVKTETTRELRDGETTRLRVGPKAEKETWVELRVDVVRAR